MYEMKRTVTYSQVGSSLTMDMAGIVHYLQDCALAHSESVGKGVAYVAEHKKAWFLSSWQIEVKRFPEYKESVTVRTWAHDFKSMYGYRNLDILDSEGAAIVCANSIWIFMDLEKMLPAKPTEDDKRGYEPEKALEMEYAPRKIKLMSDEYRIGADGKPYYSVKSIEKENNIEKTIGMEKNAIIKDDSHVENSCGKDYMGIKVKRSFLDSNNHVNNGRYVSEALDLIDRTGIKKMRVDYRRAAVLGDVMCPAVYVNDELTQVVLNDSAGSPYVIVEVSA